MYTYQPFFDRTCPKCHRFDCGMPVVARLFRFTQVMSRGIQHDIPVFINGKLAAPHIPSLDCVCDPCYAEITVDGIDTKNKKPIQIVKRIAFHCLKVDCFEHPGR